MAENRIEAGITLVGIAAIGVGVIAHWQGRKIGLAIVGAGLSSLVLKMLHSYPVAAGKQRAARIAESREYSDGLNTWSAVMADGDTNLLTKVGADASAAHAAGR